MIHTYVLKLLFGNCKISCSPYFKGTSYIYHLPGFFLESCGFALQDSVKGADHDSIFVRTVFNSISAISDISPSIVYVPKYCLPLQIHGHTEFLGVVTYSYIHAVQLFTTIINEFDLRV